MSIRCVLQILAMDLMAAGLYLLPVQRDDLGPDRQRLGVRAQGTDEALNAVRRHPLDDAFDDERRTAVAQMIDHM